MTTKTPTTAAALAMYRRACETHKRSDWRQACHLLACIVEHASGAPSTGKAAKASSEPQASRTATLCEYLSGRGGIRDDGGELRARDAELWHRAKPFRRRLIREDGMSLEAAAELAWEAGYFPDIAVPRADGPENMHPVSGDMLVAAIDRELAGSPLAEVDDDYWQALESFEHREAA
jgi:hypothetical protein